MPKPSGLLLDPRVERLIVATLIFVSVLVMLPRTRTTAWGSANTKSRAATIEMLVERGTFSIDKTPYNKTMDRIKIDGKLYSSKPPMLPVIGAGVYWVVNKALGWKIRDGKFSKAHVTLNLVLMTGAHLLFLIFLYRLGLLLLRTSTARLLTVAFGAFGWFGFGYVIDLNNHTPAAFLSVAAIYYAAVVHQRRESKNTRAWILGGLAIGFLPTIDLPSGALSVALAVWMLTVHPRRALTLALPAALAPVIVHLWLTWLYSGSIRPAYIRPEVYEKRSSGPRDGKFIYWWNLYLGHHGLLPMAPFMLPAAVGMVRQILKRGRYRGLAIVLVVTFFVEMVFYVFRTNGYGGVCVGPRWLLPIAAASLIFVGIWWDDTSDPLPSFRWWILLPLLFLGGSLQGLDALDNPWKVARWQKYSATKGYDLQKARKAAKRGKPPAKGKKKGKAAPAKKAKARTVGEPTKAKVEVYGPVPPPALGRFGPEPPPAAKRRKK